MASRHRRAALLRAALTANALKPSGAGTPLAIPSFFAGWVTTELAPQNLLITAGATARGLLARKGQRDNVALALNVATLAGLSVLVRQSLRSSSFVENGLREQFPDIPAAEAELRKDQVLRHATPFRFGHPDVEVIREIQYTGSGRRHRLDILKPRGDVSNAPVLFHVHGGGWTIGNKEQQALPLMNYLASRGWVCVTANYRLSPKATWPDHLVDAKAALAWTHEHIAEYGGDPSFVAVTGGSAGGHLAALLGLTVNDPRYQPGFEDADTSVQACIPHYAVYDMADSLQSRGGVRQRDMFLGPTVFKAKYAENPAIFHEASPLEQVHADAPPFLVVHGTHDSLASVEEARVFVERLRGVSHNPVAYIELPGTQHAFDVFHSITSSTVVRGVERFLAYTLAEHKQSVHA